MALFDRSTAKAAITATENEDKELDAALNAGHILQLRIGQENNRHKEAMKGKVGLFFGDQVFAATLVATLAMIFGLLGAAFCLYWASKDSSNADFWQRNLERALAFSSASLAFIFGKSSAKE